jgi:hypothetical protein
MTAAMYPSRQLRGGGAQRLDEAGTPRAAAVMPGAGGGRMRTRAQFRSASNLVGHHPEDRSSPGGPAHGGRVAAVAMSTVRMVHFCVFI